jgi:hypothetical protein
MITVVKVVSIVSFEVSVDALRIGNAFYFSILKCNKCISNSKGDKVSFFWLSVCQGICKG